jgi:hypothetical protein
MKADVSRLTFDPAKRFTGVVAQQGRVQLDADWNERDAIATYLARTQTTDVVGRTGVPKEGGGFAVTADGGDLLLSPGRMYVDGILCENAPSLVPVTATSASAATVSTCHVDGRALAADDPVEVLVPGAAPVPARLRDADAAARTVAFDGDVPGLADGVAASLRRRPSWRTQPDLDAVRPDGAGRYVVYADVWERLVTILDDPRIAERALGQAADTTARTKAVWQLRLARVGDVGNGGCDSPWRPADPTGTLAVRLDPLGGEEGPCVLPPATGFRGLEHQLYRVEVHDGTTFLWQRDNASVVALLEDLGTEVVVSDVGHDEHLGFRIGDLVEATDDAIELAGLPGDLCRVVDVDRATRVLTLDHAPAVDAARTPKLRRWDGRGDIGAGDWADLENGVQVRFDGGTFRAGDHWLVPARAATATDTGDVEWPRADDGTPLPSLPHGVRHHYAALAVADYDGETFGTVLDCRDLFPPLTAITASDVSYAEGECDLDGATTVQEALDALCRREGKCTVLVQPGPGWYRPLLALAPGQDAEICFPVGEFAVDRTITLTGLGAVLVTGSGPGTRLVVRKQEAVLAFEGCASVTVRDLSAAGGVAADPKDAAHLNGALSFHGCGDVAVDSVVASCAPREARAATCLTVGGGPDGQLVRSVRVTRSRLDVGQFQTGLLVVDARRVHVEDNEIEVRPLLKAELVPLGRNLLLQDAIRRMLVLRDVAVEEHPAEPAPAAPDKPAKALPVKAVPEEYADAAPSTSRAKEPPTHTVPLAGNRSMKFTSTRETAPAWKSLLAEHAKEFKTPDAARTGIRRLATRFARGELARPGTDAAKFIGSIQRRMPAVAVQGVVVGGRVAEDVRVVGNTLTGVLQGVHVGLSDAGSGGKSPLSAGRVVVSGNTVSVVVPPVAVRARHGVFVGNCASLLVEDNRIAATVPDKRPIEGIRVFGVLGRMAVVRANHLSGFTTGIAFTPLGPPRRQRDQWVVAENLAESASPVVAIPEGQQSRVRTTPDNVG